MWLLWSACVGMGLLGAMILGRKTFSERDWLHPTQLVTKGIAGKGGIIGSARRWGSRLLYEYLGRFYPQPFWTCMNYGYADLSSSSSAPSEDAAFKEALAMLKLEHQTDEGETGGEYYGLRLYLHVAAATPFGGDLSDKEILEIGSGRGGGAAFVGRVLRPKHLLGVDFSSSAVEFCRRRHCQKQGEDEAGERRYNLEFQQGDAENLVNVPSSSKDVVMNVESAHCYGSMSKFLSEVRRVLCKGGYFTMAGFVKTESANILREQLKESGLKMLNEEDITPNVLRSLQLDEARKRKLIEETFAKQGYLHSFFKGFAKGAYALEGTNMRVSFERGETKYLSFVLQKV
ncbi:Class I SAM-dependent methyltransferase [Balamuthia mandrillaris]